MDTVELNAKLMEWWNQTVEDDFEWLKESKLQLAHYTSMDVAEKILRHDEIWFSNPLYMNDHTELVAGIDRATDLFFKNDDMSFFNNDNIYHAVEHYYISYVKEFREHHMLDVYVLCFCSHDSNNDNGLLSMWRGYGAQGEGVALIFNTGFLLETEEPLLVVSRVEYMNDHKRDEKIENIISSWFDAVKSITLTEDNVYIPVKWLFERFFLLSLTVKHEGFQEEREWRLIYLPRFDSCGLLRKHYDYAVTRNGIEPKLKLPIMPLPNSQDSWSFFDILDCIIIGPTANSILSEKSFCRMLEKLEKEDFKNKVRSSKIPLRK